MIWLDDINKQQNCWLKLYHRSEGDSPCLTFNPLKISNEPDWNPMFEEWHCCSEPMIIYFEDYNHLLKSYFALMFPTKDAFDGTPEPIFDEIYYNWLSAEDWNKALSAIKRDLPKFSPEERKFYEAFLKWFDEALGLSSIIICESNL